MLLFWTFVQSCVCQPVNLIVFFLKSWKSVELKCPVIINSACTEVWVYMCVLRIRLSWMLRSVHQAHSLILLWFHLSTRNALSAAFVSTRIRNDQLTFIDWNYNCSFFCDTIFAWNFMWLCSIHTLTQANKDIGMHTDGSVPLVHVYPVCDWWSLPLPPRPTAATWIGGEGKRCELDVTEWLTAVMDHKDLGLHFCSPLLLI